MQICIMRVRTAVTHPPSSFSLPPILHPSPSSPHLPSSSPHPPHQLYWFKFILRLLYKVLVKGEKGSDTREEEKATEGVVNGLHKRPTTDSVEKKEQ